MKSEQSWLELMKNDGQFSERVLSDECERIFWKDFLSIARNTQKDEYSYVIEKEIWKILKEINPKSILEIGPGWGNYTFALAKSCKELVCLDISKDVLNLIDYKASQEKIHNIKFIHKSWENQEDKSFDVIFAYNCFYRMRDIAESLNKIHRCTKKLAIIGMNSKIDRPCMLEIEDKLGIRVKKSKLDYRLLRDILLELGISPEVIELKIIRKYEFESLDDAVSYEKRFFLDENYPENEITEIVSKHYTYTSGKYIQSHEMCSGIIFWKKD